MQAQPHPQNDARLAALREFDILDTPRESDFDEIVELASRICDMPMSLISLVEDERQWFKAEVGLGADETSLENSICAHAILEPGVTVIPDTLLDPRSADNALCTGEPNLRFYAGAVLETDDGLPIGTLCVLDSKPRELDETQKFALKVLANQVMAQLKFRKTAADELRARKAADAQVVALEQAARNHDILIREIDHRVKNSLGVIASMMNMQAQTATDEVAESLNAARDRVMAIAALHEQMHLEAHYDEVDFRAYVDRLAGPIRQGTPPHVTLEIDVAQVTLPTPDASSAAIILNELVANSLKHAFPDKRRGTIRITGSVEGQTLRLEVSDDGVGMGEEPKGGYRSLGMRVVRSLSRQLGGTLEVGDNAPGTRTAISWPLTKDRDEA